MNQPLLQRQSLSGLQWWWVIALALGLVIVVALTLALWRQATVAKDCHQETPLPPDVRLVAPGADVPEAVARFAGAWTGAWRPSGLAAIYLLLRGLVHGQSPVPLCHTRVVEEALPNGYARVILSIGSAAYWDVPLPGFWCLTGRILDGTLRFQLPDGLRLTYRAAGETLQGTFDIAGGTGRMHLTRVADLSQVGCGERASGLLQAPPSTGPRDRLTVDELLRVTAAGPSPIHNAYFMPVGQSAPALHAFKGTVTVDASTMFRARYGCPGLAETLPGFSVAFFTQGEYLVLVMRDIL